MTEDEFGSGHLGTPEVHLERADKGRSIAAQKSARCEHVVDLRHRLIGQTNHSAATVSIVPA